MSDTPPKPDQATVETTAFPHDLSTHRQNWRSALVFMGKDAETMGDADSVAFIKHELEVFDRVMAELDSFAERYERLRKVILEEDDVKNELRRFAIQHDYNHETAWSVCRVCFGSGGPGSHIKHDKGCIVSELGE